LPILRQAPALHEVTKIAGTLDVRSREEEFINIQPIQAAGRLTTEARKALISYGDGLFHLRLLPQTVPARQDLAARNRRIPR